MEIESKRLVLREITWDDLERIHKLYCCPQVEEYNTLGIPKDMEETRDRVLRIIESQKATPRTSYTWKIVQKDTGEFIGMAGITLSADRFRRGEIFYELFPAHWGCGYATEVAKVLVRHGFRYFQLHRIEAGVATGNLRSIRVLEKAGMTREGIRRKILPIRGRWVDNYHYAIVEDDPPEGVSSDEDKSTDPEPMHRINIWSLFS